MKELFTIARDHNILRDNKPWELLTEQERLPWTKIEEEALKDAVSPCDLIAEKESADAWETACEKAEEELDEAKDRIKDLEDRLEEIKHKINIIS